MRVSLVSEVLVVEGHATADVGVERDLVVLVECGPDVFGVGHVDLDGLAGKRGQGVAVTLVGADEVADALVGPLEREELTQAASGVLVLEDRELEGAVLVADARDAWREVGGIGLELASHAAVAEGAPLDDRVGLVAVGHDQRRAHGPHGMVDDQARVGEKGGIVRLGADAVIRGNEDTIAAVGATPHDPVVDATSAHHDATARVGVVPQELTQVLHRRFLSSTCCRCAGDP